MGFWLALEFLTVLPSTRRRLATPEAVGHSLAYFPLVGLLLGLILWGLDLLLRLVLPIPLVSALLMVALAILTGGLHLDGFIDTCDGLGKTTPQARLEVMRDSRVGAFGVMGVALLLLVKYSALVSLLTFSRAWALILMPILGRWAMVLALWAFPYARPQGLGLSFSQQAGWQRFLIATIVSLGLATILGRWVGLATMLTVGLVAWGVGYYLKRQFQGLTGDNYGAINELAEAVSLIAIILLT